MFERARISTVSVLILNIILTSYIPLFVGVPVIMTHRVEVIVYLGYST